MERRVRQKQKPPLPLAEWRKHARLSQKEAAELLGVHPITIAKWESGETGVNVDRLPDIAKAYGATDAAALWQDPKEAWVPEAQEAASLIAQAPPERRRAIIDAIRLMIPKDVRKI